MGIFDKAKDLLNEHNAKIDAGIDKAADFIDSKTGGQHGSHIDSFAEQAKQRIDDFSGPQEPVAPPEASPAVPLPEEPLAADQPNPGVPPTPIPPADRS